MASNASPEIDFSPESWIYNIRSVLYTPYMLFSLVGLVLAGSFLEMTSRKSLEVLDNVVGKSVLFLMPFFFAYTADWAMGLLAAVVSMIVLSKLKVEDKEEGFINESETDEGISTKLVTNSRRWFVEKVLDEHPVAIADDRVITRRVTDYDMRTNSASPMNNTGPSDSS